MRALRYGLWAVAIVAVLVFAAGKFMGVTSIGAESANNFQPSFNLIDHRGETVSEKTYRGKWLLTFLGFTNCPDVCPTTLSDIAIVMDQLGADALDVAPLFITIDPERDRVEDVAEYVSAFHPSITGLTGSETQIEAAAKSFKAFFEKVPEETMRDGYTMAHTSSLYLISPGGDFVRTYSFGSSPDDIARDLEARL